MAHMNTLSQSMQNLNQTAQPITQARIDKYMQEASGGCFFKLKKIELAKKLDRVQTEMHHRKTTKNTYANTGAMVEDVTGWELTKMDAPRNTTGHWTGFTINGVPVYKVGKEVYMGEQYGLMGTVENDKPITFFKRTAKVRKAMEA